LSSWPGPKSIHEALSGADGEKWRAALDKELRRHRMNATLKLMPLPPGRKALRSSWVLVIKTNDEPGVETFKARAITYGCQQIKGVEFVETWAPTGTMNTLRTLVAIQAQRKMKSRNGDAQHAFLNSKMDVERGVYMRQLPGTIDPGTEELVSEILKAINGVRQGPRLWYRDLSKNLTDKNVGLMVSGADPCLFYKHFRDNLIIFYLYVDDFRWFYHDNEETEAEVLRMLSHIKYDIRDTTDNREFLGLNIYKKGDSMLIAQSVFAQEIVSEHFVMPSPPCRFFTPMRSDLGSDFDVLRDLTVDEASVMTDKPYRTVVGKLMFLACGSRPDISFPVGRLAWFGSKPRPCHWDALQYLLGYVRESRDLKLKFSPDSSSLNLKCFSDSDLGGCQATGRSITGFCNILSNACIT
jgi:hypothetical protein